MTSSSNLITTLVVMILSAVLAVTTAQETFQFCGGRDLIHAVIKVCSRSVPDEPVRPAERPTTAGEC